MCVSCIHCGTIKDSLECPISSHLSRELKLKPGHSVCSTVQWRHQLEGREGGERRGRGRGVEGRGGEERRMDEEEERSRCRHKERVTEKAQRQITVCCGVQYIGVWDRYRHLFCLQTLATNLQL